MRDVHRVKTWSELLEVLLYLRALLAPDAKKPGDGISGYTQLFGGKASRIASRLQLPEGTCRSGVAVCHHRTCTIRKPYEKIIERHIFGGTLKLTRTLAAGASLALLAGSLAPAVYAAPTYPASCTEIGNEEGITETLDCGVYTLEGLQVADTVKKLRLVTKGQTVINDLRLLSAHQTIQGVEIYGATEEAITAALSMPNLRELQLNFPEGTILSAKAKSELAQLKQLDMLQLTETGISDFRWLAQLTALKNFYSYDQRELPPVPAGSTIKFEPFIDINGKAEVPTTAVWSEDDMVPFTSITSTSAVAQSGGERHLYFGAGTIPEGSSLKHLGIGRAYTIGITDVDDGLKPLRPVYEVYRAHGERKDIPVVGDLLNVPDTKYGIESVQWLREGKPIVFGEGGWYRIVEADAGKRLTARITTMPRKSYDGKKTYVPSATFTQLYDVPIPASLAKHPVPKISGSGLVSEKLTATLDSTVFPKAKKSYQWMMNNKPIKGATSTTFTPGLAQTYQSVSVRVTIDGVQSNPVVMDSAQRKITMGKLSAAKPTITGTAKVGSKLTAKAAPANKPGAKLTYIWLRDGKGIFQQHKSTYTLTPADFGKKISVDAQYTSNNYDTAVVRSSAKTVAAGTMNVTKKPAVSGKKVVGKTVKLSAGSYSPKAEKVTYQWMRNGKNIKGATKSSYKVTKADRSAKLTVKVNAAKKGYTTRTATLTVK